MTFIARKPEYKPQFFGILQTLSLSVWIAIISVFIGVLIIYCMMLKWKHPFSKIFFHTFAVLLRQSSIIIPSSIKERILIYSWMIGAMFLCLAYDSVVLSFLAFPPVVKIKHLTDLARAVNNGDYHCMSPPSLGIGHELMASKEKYLRIIGRDIHITNSKQSYGKYGVSETFIRKSRKENLAFFLETGNIDKFPRKYFISEDRFLQSMGAMIVSKGFCCKRLLDKFVHRMLDSGIFFKIYKDANLLVGLPFLLKYSDDDSSKRKLVLTDVAPAFIFLVSGYFLSCLCLIGEMILNRKKKFNHVRKIKRRRNILKILRN